MQPRNKGPWRVSEMDRRCVVTGDDLVVADVVGWRDTNDAALIAAAPDMLNALQLVAAHYPHWASHFKACQIDNDTIALVRAAIAKAEGK